MRLVAATLTLAVGMALDSVAHPHTAQAVSIYVDVTGQDGARMAGLAAGDFQVTSDGTPCVIQSLVAANDTLPLSLVLLVDNTTSVRKFLKTDTLQKDIQTSFIAELRASDRVRLGRITHQSWLQTRFTSDRSELREVVRMLLSQAPAASESPIWDAIDDAVVALQTETGRRAVIVITDGRATGNRRGREEVIRHAAASNVSLTFVGGDFPVASFVPEPSEPWDLTALRSLAPAAAMTGGMLGPMFRPPVGESVTILPGTIPDGKPGPILRKILWSLRTSYLLSFVPPAADTAVHSLAVSVSRAGASVRFRQYYAAERSAATQ